MTNTGLTVCPQGKGQFNFSAYPRKGVVEQKREKMKRKKNGKMSEKEKDGDQETLRGHMKQTDV